MNLKKIGMKYMVSGEILVLKSKKKIGITFKNGTYSSSDFDFPIGENYINPNLPRTNKPLPDIYYPNKNKK